MVNCSNVVVFSSILKISYDYYVGVNKGVCDWFWINVENFCILKIVVSYDVSIMISYGCDV